MRHPLLRILVALLIGVVSPLCCCRAMAVVGTPCGGAHVAAVESESCCGGCVGDPASEQGREAPTDERPHAPGECPSCPSCDGVAGGAAAKVESKLPAFEPQPEWLAAVTVAVLWNLPPLDLTSAVRSPGWASDPPFLKANREALRWHCALLV